MYRAPYPTGRARLDPDASYPFDQRRGGVLVLDENGPRPRLQPFATGLRNPVGFGPDGALYFASDSGIQGLFRLSPSTTDTTTAE